MIINGRKLADEILTKIKKEAKKLPRRLSIGAVLVGENPAAISFLKQKAKVAKILGIKFKILLYKPEIKTEALQQEIFKLNKNSVKNNSTIHKRSSVNGIIIQLPLPRHIKTQSILNIINPKKDIDALSKSPLVLAPTIEAIKFIFQKYKINLKNKNILIVGRGRLVGEPIYNWLADQESSRNFVWSKKIKIIDINEKNQLPKLAREADIIISGVGKSGLIKGVMIKKGAVLIDFGFGKIIRKNPPPLENKSLISKREAQFSKGGGGDFDFESCAKKAKLITPVPGGMGPIMVAMLFKNLFKLNKS